MSLNILKHSVMSRVALCAAAAIAAAACSKADKPIIDPPPPPPPPVATIGLSPASVTFMDTVGTTSPAAATVAVANGGTGSLGGLAAGTITYGAGASGWLTASMSGAAAPATLTLTAVNTGLAAGSYTATVPVTSSGAANSPQNVTVTFSLASNAPPPPPPPPTPIQGVTVAAAGNIAQCGNGQNLAIASANAIAGINPDFVFALGDNAYPRDTASTARATLQDYLACYEPNWGQFKAKTYATVGNREVSPDSSSAGFDAYWAPRNGTPKQNWYSFDVGTGAARWHIVVLNIVSGGIQFAPVQYSASSAQYSWLYRDLQNNLTAKCTLVFWHDPMWMSSNNGTSATDKNGYRRQPQRGIWNILYNANVDVVLGGGDHIYERFAPMRYWNPNNDATGPEFLADSLLGIRQFTVGLAGDGPMSDPGAPRTMHPLSQYRMWGNGVLKLVLGDNQYTWEFVNGDTRSQVHDSGTGTCH